MCLDHSSFCFINNFISKIEFNDKQKLLFINYLNEIKDIKPEKISIIIQLI